MLFRSIVSSYTGFNTHITTPSSIGDVKCTVITSNYNIYICLKQQIVLGEIQPSIYSPDTGVPVGTNTTIVKTADGYYWKFLGTTSTSDVIKFSSKFYHPIQTIPSAPGGGDPYLPQWNAQVYSANFKGGIYVINVTAAGSGYNGGSAGTHTESDPQLKIIGDGTGLQFTVTYGTGGSISDIEITNPGTGYTYASVVTTGGTNAAFDIIFTPMSGLGVNPVYNVCARFLLVSTALVGDEGGKFTTTNDYRKVSLVYNPTNFGTSTVATSATLDASTTLVVQTGLPSGAYLVDAIVTGATSGAKGRVVDFNPSTGHVRVIRTGSENIGSTGANVSFQVSETLNTTPGTGTGVIASIISPDVQIYSGDIVYTEYRAPINRDPSQTENISVIAKF